MKKLFLTVCCLIAASVVMAQSDTVANVKNVYVMRDSDKSRMLLEVSGYQIAFTTRKKSEPKVKLSIGFKDTELGFSLLTAPGYGDYPVSQRGFLDQRVGKSIHFGFRLFDIGVNLNKKRTLQFNTGLHLMCDNYVFDQNITLDRVGGRVVPQPLDREYKKSKLTTAAFGIPVQLTYLPTKGLRISAQVYGDLLFNAHTKYKKPITKDRFSGVNVFQVGVGAALTYKNVGIYAKYGLTEFFKGDASPTTHPVTVGLTFNLFCGL